MFLTRLVPVVRTLTPAAAGTAGVAYLRFLPASLTGAFMWSALYTFAGALAGASIGRVEEFIGRAGWLLVAVLAVLVGAVVLVRRRRRKARGAATGVRPRRPDAGTRTRRGTP